MIAKSYLEPNKKKVDRQIGLKKCECVQGNRYPYVVIKSALNTILAKEFQVFQVSGTLEENNSSSSFQKDRELLH